MPKLSSLREWVRRSSFPLLVVLTVTASTGAIRAGERLLPVLTISSSPQPGQIEQANRAMADGSVVAMRNAIPARFAAYFGVGLADLGSKERTAKPQRSCIIAARRLPDGRIRSYMGETLGSGSNDIVRCDSHFQSWLSRQSQLQDTANPPGWTEVLTTTLTQSDDQGDTITITPTVYRSNTIDTNNDYFMAIIENQSTPGNTQSGQVTYRVTTLGANVPNVNVFDSGPGNILTPEPSHSFTIGGNVAVQPTVQPAFTQAWSQGQIAVVQMSSSSWWEYPPSGPIDSILGYQGIVFQLPKGTTRFPLTISTQSTFTSPGAPTVQLNASIAVTSPLLSVPSEYYVVPGKTLTMQIDASRNVSWQFTSTPLWANVDTTVQTGSQKITTSTDGAEVNTTYHFLLDGAPAYSTPTLANGAVDIAVHVVAALPASGVLMAGGTPWGDSAPLATAEIWDPATNLLTATNGPMNVARQWHTSTLLGNGKILLTGGYGPDGKATQTTELYDPTTGTFTAGPLMISKRTKHTATLLADGTVLVAGGFDDTGAATGTAELYHPGTGSSIGIFDQTGNMAVPRGNLAASLLSDGSVVVTGGASADGQQAAVAEAEIYSVTAKSFTATDHSMWVARQGHAAVQLPYAYMVMEVGGFNDSQTALNNSEVFIYGDGSEGFAGPLPVPFATSYPAAVLQPDEGQVLVIGGAAGLTSSAVFFPPYLTWTASTTSMSEQRDHPTAVTIQNTGTVRDGYVFTAGGVVPDTGSSNGTALELYQPSTQTWSVTAHMNTSRTAMTSTLFGLSVSPIPASGGGTQ